MVRMKFDKIEEVELYKLEDNKLENNKLENNKLEKPIKWVVDELHGETEFLK